MYLYAIGTNGKEQKIGFSSDPEARLKTLQTANAEPLIVHYKFEINEDTAHKFEQYVHHQHNHRRKKGEWFDMSPQEVVSMMMHHEIMRETIENSL